MDCHHLPQLLHSYDRRLKTKKEGFMKDEDLSLRMFTTYIAGIRWNLPKEGSGAPFLCFDSKRASHEI